MPIFEHSLRTGDEVEYNVYIRRVVAATIVGIVDGWLKNDKLLLVRTDAFDQMNEDYNKRFKIVSSKSKDAPPKGEWMRLSKVNFVRGKFSPKEKEVIRSY